MAWMLIVFGLLAAAILLPRFGLVARARAWRALRGRARFEDALKHLLHREHQGRPASARSLADTLGLPEASAVALVRRMESAGLLGFAGDGLQLTPEGERWALHVVRAHRLWERYLADEAGVPLGKVHGPAEKIEHRLSRDEVDALDAHLGHPQRDPHGHPIPTADGLLAPLEAVSLTDWTPEKPARIVHIEDKPDVIFKQILAADLRPGKVVRILESSRERLTISDGENEHRLAPAVASNIRVTAAPEAVTRPAHTRPLADLPEGEEAIIVAIDPDCRGFNRRRLLDLGMTPGTRVRVELSTIGGNPRAYRVRSTLIGLRHAQARLIWVQPAAASDERGQQMETVQREA